MVDLGWENTLHRNVKAKLGAITRIDGAASNSIEKLSPIEAFALIPAILFINEMG